MDSSLIDMMESALSLDNVETVQRSTKEIREHFFTPDFREPYDLHLFFSSVDKKDRKYLAPSKRMSGMELFQIVQNSTYVLQKELGTSDTYQKLQELRYAESREAWRNKNQALGQTLKGGISTPKRLLELDFSELEPLSLQDEKSFMTKEKTSKDIWKLRRLIRDIHYAIIEDDSQTLNEALFSSSKTLKNKIDMIGWTKSGRSLIATLLLHLQHKDLSNFLLLLDVICDKLVYLVVAHKDETRLAFALIEVLNNIEVGLRTLRRFVQRVIRGGKLATPAQFAYTMQKTHAGSVLECILDKAEELIESGTHDQEETAKFKVLSENLKQYRKTR